jgi:hypothetical protein
MKLQKFTLGKEDLISLAKGLGIALIGAAVTYFTAYVTKTDFGVWTPIIVAFWSLAANIIRKSADGVKE